MRRRDAAFLILGVLVGFGGTRLVGPETTSETEGPGDAARHEAPSPDNRRARAPSQTDRFRPLPPRSTQGSAPENPYPPPTQEKVEEFDALFELPSDHGELERLVADLESDLERARTELEYLAGSVPEAPAKLDERFVQESLSTAMNDAASDLGGAVSAVDCTEYPCFAFGEIPHPGGEAGEGLRRLLGSGALGAYSSDARGAYAWDEVDEETGEIRTHFGVSFYPQAGGRANKTVQHRLSTRWHEWLSAVRREHE